MIQQNRRNYLITELLRENPKYSKLGIPSDIQDQKRMLRALFNVRMPLLVDDEFIKEQNEYLKEETREKGITSIDDLNPIQDGIYLWRGDITTLKCDSIVNAANSGMLGCFIPNHGCIDNIIHTYAGIQLRLACAEIMQKQGHDEETGKAKITPGFNLPCKYILHTIGPIIYGELTERDEELLRSCYLSCLKLADENRLRNIAFCCVSTGEFHFPNERAAEIALETVKDYRKQTGSPIEVIFNVFKELDYDIYKRLLSNE